MKALMIVIVVGTLLLFACVPAQQTTGAPPIAEELLENTEEQETIPATTFPSMSEDEALAADAQWYADHFNVSLEEAIRRLQLQEPVGILGARLEEEERETFAGLWVENAPEYRIVVAFTENGEETIRPYIEGRPYEASVEVRTAAHTLDELQTANEAIFTEVVGLGIEAVSGPDIQNNRIVMEVLDIDELNAALEAASIELPDYFEVVEVESMPVLEGDN